MIRRPLPLLLSGPLTWPRAWPLMALLLLLSSAVGCSGDSSGAPPDAPGEGEGEGEGEGSAEGEGEGEGSAEGEGEGEGRPSCEQDGDDDGYGLGPHCLGEDCRDDDGYAHPGAAERCNGLDDDCDGATDACECAPWLGTVGCIDGLVCAAAGDDAVARCVPAPTGELVADGEPCGPPACRAGSQCVRWAADRQVCTHTCDPHSGQGCLAPEECLNFLARNPEIGLCREPPPACDIYLPDACAPGTACRPFYRLVGAPDLRCQTAGPLGPGEVCGSGVGECVAGMICVKHGSAASRTCQRVCRSDTDCPSGEGGCIGRTNSLQITYCHGV